MGKDLNVRVQHHRDAVRLLKWENVLYRYVFNSLHTIDWRGARFLHRSTDEFKRGTVESFLTLNIPKFNIAQRSKFINNFQVK